MTKTEHTRNRSTTHLELSPRELVIISNALNAVCHSVSVTETDFPFLIGASRDESQALLHRVQSMLDAVEPPRPQDV